MPTYTGNTIDGDYLYVIVDSTQNQANNTSTISWTIGWAFRSPSPTDRDLDNGTLTIGGVNVWSNANPYNYTANFTERNLTLASGSRTYTHGSDGNLSVGISASCKPWGDPVSSISATYVLPRIPKVPGAPTNLVATPSGTMLGSVSFTWSAPSDNGGSTITGYRIYDSSGNTLTTTSGTGTSTTITLAASYRGANQTFTVAAINAIGVGPKSAASPSVYVPNVPGTPTGVSATPSASVERRVSVSWTAPSNNGSTIVGYTVYARVGTTLIDEWNTTGTGTSTTRDFAAERLFASVTFTVLARNSLGSSTESSPSTAVTINGNPNPPTLTTATNNNVNVTSSGSIHLQWSAGTQPNSGTTITGYSVFAAPVGQTRVLVATTTGTGTSLTITDANANPDLSDGVEHTFDVRARNAFSDSNSVTSPASNTINAFVSGPPGPPTSPAAFNTFTDGTVAANAVKLTWVAPTNTGRPPGISSYIITWTSSVGGGTQTVSSGTTTLTITGLQIVEYTFAIVAKNSLTSGGESTAATVSITPAPDPSWTDNSIADTFRVGVPYSDQIVRSPGGTIAYEVASGILTLPPGITLNTSTGVLSGTPTTQGKYSFVLRSTVNSVSPLDLSFTVYVRPGARKKTSDEAITIFRRFNGTSWVDVGTVDVSGSPIGMRRYNGTSWVSTTIPTV